MSIANYTGKIIYKNEESKDEDLKLLF